MFRILRETPDDSAEVEFLYDLAFAPGRTAYGEQFHRAAYGLAAVTGNVGVSGGNSGCSGGARLPRVKRFTAGGNPAGARVGSALLADLLTRGRAGGYPADIKLMYSVGGDLVNQCGNVNKSVAALTGPGVEFVVVHDHFLTPTARYADIGDGDHAFAIEQGYEMGRPSVIHLALTLRRGALADASIGGDAVVVGAGAIEA